MYYPCSENKGTDQLRGNLIAVTAKLVCAFVFAYVNCWFSHEAAHFLLQSIGLKTTKFSHVQ